MAGNANNKNNVIEDCIDEKTIGDLSSSYTNAWQIYLINQIVSKSESQDGEFCVFCDTPEYANYRFYC